MGEGCTRNNVFYASFGFYNENGFIWGFEPGKSPKYVHTLAHSTMQDPDPPSYLLERLKQRFRNLHTETVYECIIGFMMIFSFRSFADVVLMVSLIFIAERKNL